MKQFDVTVRQWQIIHDIIQTEENELLRWLDIMPIITDKSKEHFRSMKVSEFWKIANEYKYGLFDKPVTGPLPSRWEHEGRVMVCDVRLNKITGGMFIDSLELGKEYKGNDPTQLMHKFLGIYWMDKDGKYDPDTYQERCEYILNNMPMHIALPTYEHFFQLWIASLPAIQAYLNRQAAGIGLQTDGDGTLRSTGWLMGKGRIGITLPKWVSLNSLITWLTSRIRRKGKNS